MALSQKISTAATDLLGIRNPVLLAGMFAVSSPKLAAAVSNAGGLGVIGGGAYTPDQLRKALEELKGYLVDKNSPFGVDLLIPQVGGNARKTNYDYSHGKLDELIEIIIESGAKLFVCAVGIPPARVVKRLHEGGVLFMNMVGHPHHAQKAIDAGADLLCAQGGEGGGHTGDIPTVILIPAVAKVIGNQKSKFTGRQVVLVAAGGLFNRQSLAAAIMLGASAVWIGTRFILCDEAGSSSSHQQAVQEAGHGDIIQNRREEKLQLQSQGLIPMDQELKAKPDDEEVLDNAHPVLMGKVAAMVTEKLPASQIVQEMVDEAAHLLMQGRRLVKL
ncbi:Nitronate monooxygenase-domain-containing protein [Aspergillus tetrazonus]